MFGLDDVVAGGIAGLLGKAIDKIWPDPAQRDQMKLDLFKAQQAGALAELDAEVRQNLAQMEVNKVEATSDSWLAKNWRPMVGASCAASFAWTYVLQPLLSFALAASGHPVALPALDMSGMMPVLLGMLGLAGMRTWEKGKGVSGGL